MTILIGIAENTLSAAAGKDVAFEVWHYLILDRERHHHGE